jgi:two-component system, sensor histidine kinase and response regulator
MPTDPLAKSKGDILIVDDALPNLRLLSRMLKDNGYQVRGISNSAMVTTVVQAEPPDLLLLDINMPGQNGYEVCRSLKADAQSCEVPVIFISALDDVLDKVEAFSVGGVDYITKPFQVQEVLARVETHLTISRLRKQLENRVEELQTLTNELMGTNDALQASNDELNAFAHTVAHDLKNPLASSLLSLDLIEFFMNQDMKTKALKAIGTVRESSQKLNNIIDELLLLSSVRKETVEKVPLQMTDIVAHAANRLSVMMADYEACLDIPEEWPVALGYAPWIEEVWVNYLSNGIKYGGKPPHLKIGSHAQGDGFICFWVCDNGNGVPEDVVDKLFAEFTRLDQTRAQGHGLGLSIVKRIVEKLDGQVGMQNQPGGGCKFYFTLPAAPPINS